ncbi:unnamed protein product [Brassica rapa subsp. narinosa]
MERGTRVVTILHNLHRQKVVTDPTQTANHQNPPGNKTTANEAFQRLYWKFGTPSATPSTLVLVHRRVSITEISSKAKPPNTKTPTHEKENSCVHLQTIGYDSRRPTPKKTTRPQSQKPVIHHKKVRYWNEPGHANSTEPTMPERDQQRHGQTNLQDETQSKKKKRMVTGGKATGHRESTVF